MEIPEEVGLKRVSAFLRESHRSIVRRWLDRLSEAISTHSIDEEELRNSVDAFLLHVARCLEENDGPPTSSAAEHGEQRFEIGYRLSAMAREYGLLLEAIEAEAQERGLHLSIEAYGALSRMIVFGLAEAVTAYAAKERHRREEMASRHFAFVAHELRGPMQSMELALEVLRAGAPLEGPLGVIERSLGKLREHIDHSLSVAQQRASGAPEPQVSAFDVCALIEEAGQANMPHGWQRRVAVEVEAPATLEVELDRTLVWSIVSNLIRNGIKFSKEGSRVMVRVIPVGDHHLRFEVEDACGGLPPGTAEKMFTPFAQLSEDRTGFGLGLSITRQAVEVMRGEIEVHDVGHGCVIAVTLPRALEPGDKLR